MTTQLKIKVTLEGIRNLPPGFVVRASMKQEDGSVLYTLETPGVDNDQAVLDSMFTDCPDYQVVDAATA